MKNFIQPGNTLTGIAPVGGVLSGDPVLLGSVFGVAAFDAVEGAEFEISTVGVYDLPKTTGQAWAFGDPLYWDAATKKLTKTTADNLRVGTASKIAASDAATGNVKIGPSSVALGGLNAPQNAIADLAPISGGESPTEAEHNAVVTKINAILAAMRGANIIAE
jgi:predicted RecA/RadA family phage recombinase